MQIFGKQILNAVSFLHNMGLIHTDLKLENVLLVNSDWQYHRHAVHGRSRVVKRKDVVVIDLGSAIYEKDHHATVVSTRHYRAPEVVLGLFTLCINMLAYSARLLQGWVGLFHVTSGAWAASSWSCSLAKQPSRHTRTWSISL